MAHMFFLEKLINVVCTGHVTKF